jgi:hypothetical protein
MALRARARKIEREAWPPASANNPESATKRTTTPSNKTNERSK